jgi:hypothetical protein
MITLLPFSLGSIPVCTNAFVTSAIIALQPSSASITTVRTIDSVMAVGLAASSLPI